MKVEWTSITVVSTQKRMLKQLHHTEKSWDIYLFIFYSEAADM